MSDQTINTAAAPAKDRKEDLYTATPAQLIWRRFSKHALALVSLWFLVILALCALFADMVAPYAPFEVQRMRTLAPPTGIHLFHDGQFVGRERAVSAILAMADLNRPALERAVGL